MGTIVTDLKGKSGGQTFKGTKAGTVLQNNSAKSSGGKITKADAGRGVPAKRILAGIATAWRNLDDEERGSFETGAVNFPFLNKYGEAYTGSGYQVFMSLNLARISVGLSFLQTCPLNVTLTPCPTLEVADTSEDGTVEPAFTASSDFTYGLFATAPQSAGRAFEIGRTKQIAVMSAVDFNAGYAYGDDWKAVFGPWQAGGKIYLYVQPISNDSGQIAQPSVIAVIQS